MRFPQLHRVLICMVLGLIPLAAVAANMQTNSIQALNEINLVPVGQDAEIHVNFAVDVNYVSHFPANDGETVRVVVDIKDPCDAAGVIRPQFNQFTPDLKNNAVPKFNIIFPEERGGMGVATCMRDGLTNIATRKTLLIKFSRHTNYKVRMGEGGHEIIIVVPAGVGSETAVAKAPKSTTRPVAKAADATPPAAAAAVADATPAAAQATSTGSAAASASPVANTATLESLGLAANATPEQIQVAGRAALAANDSARAISLFNIQLNRPATEYTQEAQELIGRAREMAGQPTMAMAEYKLYLKLYPKSDAAKRVQERLATLEKNNAVLVAQEKKDRLTSKDRQKQGAKPEMTVTGGISQYYYGGKSWTNNHDGTGDRYNLDQSALMTSVDVTGRYRNGQTDTKIVFRDMDNHNMTSGPRFTDRNSVNAAYIEQTNNALGYFVRLGRQPGTSEGVLGRFDGVSARYTINPEWKIFGVLGQPDNGTHNTVLTNRTFFGGAVEFSPKASHISGNVYINQQVADGLVERRAVGTELRYFNNSFSSFGLLEYDTLYSAINIAMLQGNYLTSNGINLNLLLDHRRSPMLTADTTFQAVPGVTRVSDLRRTLTSDQIYSFATDLAPTSDSAVLSAFKQLSPRWQVGGDVRTNRTSSTNGVTNGTNVVPAQQASGNSYGIDMSLVGTNLILANDTNVVNGGISDDPHSTSEFLSLSNISMFRDSTWKLITSLQLSHSKTDTSATSKRYSPQITLSYSPKPNMNFEAQLGYERSFNDQAANGFISASKSDTTREYMFIGYRWDLR